MELKACHSLTQQGTEVWRGGQQGLGEIQSSRQHSPWHHHTWSLGRRCYPGGWELSWNLSPERTQRAFLARATSRGSQGCHLREFLHQFIMARDAAFTEKTGTPPRLEQESYGFSCQYQEWPHTTWGGAKETTHQGSPGAHMGSMVRHANLGAINLGWNVEYQVTLLLALISSPKFLIYLAFLFMSYWNYEKSRLVSHSNWGSLKKVRRFVLGQRKEKRHHARWRAGERGLGRGLWHKKTWESSLRGVYTRVCVYVCV